MSRLLRNPIALGVAAILLLILIVSTISIVPETKPLDELLGEKSPAEDDDDAYNDKDWR